jgi:nucleotide-binding universal stress UspA family protein
MFTHILVPVDLGSRSRPGVRAALQLAQQNQAPLTLFHAIERIDNLPAASLKGFYARLERAAKRHLLTHGRELEREGVSVRRAIVFGKVAASIVKYANEKNVDLIVMASHPLERSGPSEGVATTSYRVAFLARCAVLLVK